MRAVTDEGISLAGFCVWTSVVRYCLLDNWEEIRPINKLMPLIYKDCLSECVEKETEGELANPGSPGTVNGHL